MDFDNEHYETVKQGSVAVADWRRQHPSESFRLRRADFARAVLSSCDLGEADLEFADFRWADLQHARFAGANLKRADFHKADLSFADLTNSDLRFANLEDAVLTGAKLSGAKLGRTRLIATDLSGSSGLPEVVHAEPSTVDQETITKSQPIPDPFLRGAGVFAPTQVRVLRVIIGSPSDVKEEREAIRNAVLDWNDKFMERDHVVLKPMMWERHSTPELSKETIDHGPQFSVNRQLLDAGHLLICVFWSRIGSKTPRAESGTIEEIQEFVHTGRPVMIYFCTRSIPQNADWGQWEALRNWKEFIRNVALVDEFESLSELTQKLSNHLTTRVAALTTTFREQNERAAIVHEGASPGNEFVTGLANSLLGIYVTGSQIQERNINPWLAQLKTTFEFESERLRSLAVSDYADKLGITQSLKDLSKACSRASRFRLYSGPEIWNEFISLVNQACDMALQVFNKHIEDAGITKRSAPQAADKLRRTLRRLEDLVERLPELIEAHEFDEIKDKASQIGMEILRLSYLGLRHVKGIELDQLRSAAMTLNLTETVQLYADGGASIRNLAERVVSAADLVRSSAGVLI